MKKLTLAAAIFTYVLVSCDNQRTNDGRDNNVDTMSVPSQDDRLQRPEPVDTLLDTMAIDTTRQF